MARAKGSPKTGGRKAGTTNRVTGLLKDMILQSLADVGGVDYLKIQAVTNPGAYMSLVGKVLPLQVKTDGADPVMPTVVKHVHE